MQLRKQNVFIQLPGSIFLQTNLWRKGLQGREKGRHGSKLSDEVVGEVSLKTLACRGQAAPLWNEEIYWYLQPALEILVKCLLRRGGHWSWVERAGFQSKLWLHSSNPSRGSHVSSPSQLLHSLSVDSNDTPRGCCHSKGELESKYFVRCPALVKH